MIQGKECFGNVRGHLTGLDISRRGQGDKKRLDLKTSLNQCKFWNPLIINFMSVFNVHGRGVEGEGLKRYFLIF